MADENFIPQMYATGRFEAHPPFNEVVKTDITYKVEASRTINEMQSDNVDLYEKMFKPIGVSEDDYPAVLNRALELNAVVVVLTSRNNPNVFVLSNYFKSFPLIDGVIYERMVLVADLGACHPSMKATIAGVQEHIRDYIFSKVGIQASVKLGTIPTPGYVSQEQAEINEITRKNNITNRLSDQERLRILEARLVERENYISVLESQIQP